MTQLARVYRLLAELCDLEAGDEQVPLDVLVNIYRARMRAPLEMVSLAYRESLDAEADFAARYPAVDAVQFSASTIELPQAEVAAKRFDATSYTAAGRMERHLLQDADLAAVVDGARNDWVPYEPALTLYELSVAPAPVEAMALVLEIELKLSPASHAMLIDLANRRAALVS